MARLPTVGSDSGTWGTVLNEYLTEMPTMQAQLGADAAVGATSITLNRSAPLPFRVNTFIVIDPYTTEAELRPLTAVSGATVSFTRALTYAHSTDDAVFSLLDEGGDLLPWTWWGGVPEVNTDAQATINVTAFNRMAANEIYNAGRYGILIKGNFYVNNELTPERSTVIAGTDSLKSSVIARTGFPFTSDGSVAIIHPRRDGDPVLYEQDGPSARWWFRNFEVDGNNLANSNGILTSPQQPDSTENMRLQNCAGYGLSINDCQFHDIRNLQLDHCGVPLHIWSGRFIRVFNMACTTPAGLVAVHLDSCTDSSFYGALIETVPTTGKVFDVIGGSSRLGFYDIYTSGFSGGSVGDIFSINATGNPSNKCTYVITNAHCAQTASTVNMVNDVQRGISFNTLSTDTDRSLIFGWAQDELSEFVLGGRNAMLRNGVVDRGPGSPEGVVTAPIGATYRRTNGGAGTTFYVKESGTGNTGWVGK